MPTARPRITTERGAPSRVNRRFPLAASVEVYVAKNRVQPANSHQAKHFVSRTMTGVNWWQSLFSLLCDFCHGLLGVAERRSLRYP